jgi:hypothetical protein
MVNADVTAAKFVPYMLNYLQKCNCLLCASSYTFKPNRTGVSFLRPTTMRIQLSDAGSLILWSMRLY